MVVLVRYGELALKSAYVRRQLEDRLAANVREMFAANSAQCIVRGERGRLFVHADDESAAVRLLRRVFGIVSISPARESTSDLEALTRDVVAYAKGVLAAGQTFAIRPRRSGNHAYTSQDLARTLGRAVQDAIPGADVDLNEPDREVHVEVRGPRAYVFHEIVDGPGGLPLGSQGEALAVSEDERGMVATWLVMRRGCRVRVAGREPFLGALKHWNPGLQTLSVPPSELRDLATTKGIPFVLASLPETPSEEMGQALLLWPLVGLSTDEVRGLAQMMQTV
ncbi:MAG TPA: THUMP domain-containing protein [Thermoplasmata archaeon]|nr:THUMP domain-containing protein [Thermoplasmata archaeon]